MSLMVKDFKKMAAGTEIKGFPLMIKTARKPFKDAEGTIRPMTIAEMIDRGYFTVGKGPA